MKALADWDKNDKGWFYGITLTFAAIVLPCATLKYLRDRRNIFSGKLERDRNEIRK